MPCNLAVSITKAGVSQQWLRALLTPEILSQVLATYLSQQYKDEAMTTRVVDAQVLFTVGECTGHITNGAVEIREATGNRNAAQTLASDIEGLVIQVADSLFQQQLSTMLSPVTQVQHVQVTNNGVLEDATVLTLDVSV